ncbi:hypothetical protein Tco_0931219 [Tanacetum coccineum]
MHLKLKLTLSKRKRKTQTRRRTKKDIQLPQTSVLQDLEADEAVHKEGGDSVEMAITTAASLDAAQDSDNIIRTQTTTMPNVDILQGMDTGGNPRRQDTIGVAPAQTRSKRVLEKPIKLPLSEGHTSGSGEGRMEHQFELTANVPITPYNSPLTRGTWLGERERGNTDRVHTLFMDGTPMEITMLVEKKYPLINELLEKMLNLQLEAEEESTMAFELIKFIKSMLEE